MVRISNSRIRGQDIPIIDRVFAMEGGYVLNFSNRTFADFFNAELGVNIDDSRWALQGGSKAKRLRYFLQHADSRTALNTLNALWEYREATNVTELYSEVEESVLNAFFGIIERLGGTAPASVRPAPAAPKPNITASAASALARRLVEVSAMNNPQARGYAFEKFLKDLFDEYGLSGRASFRLVGGQIDGSLSLGGNTYLLEAKWTNAPVDAATLRAFNAKVEDKARWSRGLIVSQSGFAATGLEAFGRGKSVVCIDGLDLHEVLSHRLDLADVLALKVRHAAETGEAFVRVRDLRIPLT